MVAKTYIKRVFVALPATFQQQYHAVSAMLRQQFQAVLPTIRLNYRTVLVIFNQRTIQLLVAAQLWLQNTSLYKSLRTAYTRLSHPIPDRLKSLKQACHNQQGQATVENALIWLVLVVVLLGFVALQKRLGEGLFVEHAIRSASHSLGPNTAGTIGDVLLY